MKKILGKIYFDSIDIVCLSIMAGALIAKLQKSYRIRKNSNSKLIRELKTVSNVVVPTHNKSGIVNVRKVPILRGGDENGLQVLIDGKLRQIKIRSLLLKNKHLATWVAKLVKTIKTKQKLRMLYVCLSRINQVLAFRYGLHFAMGGSYNYLQILLLTCPSMALGYLAEIFLENSLVSILFPVVIMGVRSNFKDVDIDTVNRCRLLCQHAEDYHNQELRILMTDLKKNHTDFADMQKFLNNETFVKCEETRYSLLQRYQLRKLKDHAEVKKRVQHFAEFIKKFDDCNPDVEEVLGLVETEIISTPKLKS